MSLYRNVLEAYKLRRKSRVVSTVCALLAVVLLPAGSIQGQDSAQRLADVPIVPRGFLADLGARGRFRTLDTLSKEGKAAALRLQVQSVPVWLGQFSYSGTTYPYVMVGKPPAPGGTSRTNVSFIPVRIIFDDILDANGQPLVYDPDSIMRKVVASPIFEPNQYINGFAQYGDAIQRANFPAAPYTWHTLLNPPNVLPTLTVHVPSSKTVIFQTPQGIPLVFVDASYFEEQMFAATRFQTLHVGEFVVWITRNVFLFVGSPEFYLLGFHGALDFNNPGGALNIFTYGFAIWLDAEVADAAFGIPYGADIFALSHEVAEWIDDPFLVNFVPPWQFPGAPCFPGTDLMEVGDPLEGFGDAPFPLISNNFIYHPTNVALVPWFTRESPSSAFGGAYSFPNSSFLTSPSPVCP